MTSSEDPFAAIAEETPSFSEDEAIALLLDRYGIHASVRGLVSERDQNFEILDRKGRKFVLKIASAAEPQSVTDFQVRALLHIEQYIAENGSPVVTPTILRTLDGNSQTVMRGAGGDHVARVVSYVDGVPIGDRVPDAALCRSMGGYLAHLGRALRDFRHPASSQTLLWDMQRALALRELLHHIPSEPARRDVAAALDDFEEFALPAFGSVRRQIVHSDFNPDNVLTESGESNTVSGVIDFGDMLEAPLIADVAIGACYARPAKGDPLALIAEFLAAYHRVTPLARQEIDVTFDLVRARLCASIAILYWRASFREPGDPYLEKLLNAESFAEHFLARLADVPRQAAVQRFREACDVGR